MQIRNRALRTINNVLLGVILVVILGLIKITYQAHVFTQEAEDRGGYAGSWIGLYYIIMIPAMIVWIVLFFVGKAAERSDKSWFKSLSAIFNVVLGIIPGLLSIYSFYIKNY